MKKLIECCFPGSKSTTKANEVNIDKDNNEDKNSCNNHNRDDSEIEKIIERKHEIEDIMKAKAGGAELLMEENGSPIQKPEICEKKVEIFDLQGVELEKKYVISKDKPKTYFLNRLKIFNEVSKNEDAFNKKLKNKNQQDFNFNTEEHKQNSNQNNALFNKEEPPKNSEAELSVSIFHFNSTFSD